MSRGVIGRCERCGAVLWADEAHTAYACQRTLRRRQRGRAKPSQGCRARILERDGHRCRQCGATQRLEIDHIVPVLHGGTRDDDNLQVLCWRCNNRKGAK